MGGGGRERAEEDIGSGSANFLWPVSDKYAIHITWPTELNSTLYSGGKNKKLKVCAVPQHNMEFFVVVGLNNIKDINVTYVIPTI